MPDIRVTWTDRKDVEFRSYTRKGLNAIERVLNGACLVDRYRASVALHTIGEIGEFADIDIDRVNDPFQEVR